MRKIEMIEELIKIAKLIKATGAEIYSEGDWKEFRFVWIKE